MVSPYLKVIALSGFTFAAWASDADSLLQKLWTHEQLQGDPRELKVEKYSQAMKILPDPPHSETVLPPLDASSRGSIRSVEVVSGQKVLALTFDLCESSNERAGYDYRIVEILRQKRIPATFFAGGQWLKSHEERALQLMADPLFEVANHAWTHGNLRVLKGEAMELEIQRTQQEYDHLRERLMERIKAKGLGTEALTLPGPMQLFRFPYGACSSESLEAVNRRGLKAIQWDVVSGDADKHQSPSRIKHVVQNTVRPGSIVVFHANGRGYGTLEALPTMIEHLSREGYRFLKVSDLLKLGRPQSVESCYENRPGDNLRYDRLFRAKNR